MGFQVTAILLIVQKEELKENKKNSEV